MTISLGLIMAATLLASILLTGWTCFRAGREDGYEEGRADRAQEKLTERRSAAPRHARTAPRRDREGMAVAPPGPFPPVPAARPPWYQYVQPRTPGTQVPYRPQPSGTSPRAITGTMPRVHLTGDDDTGEIRRIGAETLAAIEEGRI